MSKAFTKEDDGSLPEKPHPLEFKLPPGTKNYLTPNGAERLRAELKSPTTDDRRRVYLTQSLESAEVIDPLTQTGDEVRFGATVEVLTESGARHTYRIVGIDETQASTGKISWLSPIAKALLQSKKGDFVTVKTPSGAQELEILAVRYEVIL